MYSLPSQSSQALLMSASVLLADTSGEALRSLEERMTNAQQAIFAPSADGSNAQQEGVSQETQRGLAAVFEAAERILVLARIYQQRKT